MAPVLSAVNFAPAADMARDGISACHALEASPHLDPASRLQRLGGDSLVDGQLHHSHPMTSPIVGMGMGGTCDGLLEGTLAPRQRTHSQSAAVLFALQGGFALVHEDFTPRSRRRY